jgi:hypothetical protein
VRGRESKGEKERERGGGRQMYYNYYYYFILPQGRMVTCTTQAYTLLDAEKSLRRLLWMLWQVYSVMLCWPVPRLPKVIQCVALE